MKTRSWLMAFVAIEVCAVFLSAKQGRLAFDRISMEQGLSQALVRVILEDREGFLWFGTMEGLNRFDGYAFTILRHNPGDSHSLSHDSVTAMAEDKEGRIWVGTEGGGLSVYEPMRGNFTRYLHDPQKADSLGSNYVGALWTDPEGRVWIGADCGIDCMEPRLGRFRHYYPLFTEGRPAEVIVRSIQPSQQKKGDLWLGTNQGVFRFSAADGRFFRFSHRSGDVHSLIDNDVYAVYESTAEKGSIWVGTLAGLDRLDVGSGRFSHWMHRQENGDSISSNRIRAIFEDRRNSLWIGTDGGGLNRFDRQTMAFTSYVNDPRDVTSLSQNSVLVIYEDRSGFMWLGTSGGGINRLNSQKSGFVLYKNEPGVADSLQVNDVLSICEPRLEPWNLWVGNQDGGLNQVDRRSGKVKHYLHDPANPASLSHNSVYAILEDRDSGIWLGTMKGLNRFDPGRERFIRYLHDPEIPDSLPNNFVLTLFQDRNGRLWVGTRGGLGLMNKQNGRFQVFRCRPQDSRTLTNDIIIAMLAPSWNPNELWIGTRSGLNRLDQNDFTIHRHYIAIPGATSSEINYIMHIAESLSEPGILWLGTQNGMLRFDSQRNTFIHIREGLPGNIVYAILPTIISQGSAADSSRMPAEEFLWMSTSKGLSRFQPRTGRIKNYGWLEGILISDFNRGAYFHSVSGEMFFGGTLGMYGFFPSAISDNTHVPPVVITSVKVNEKEVQPLRPILERNELTLNYNQNFISFEFTALDFTIPVKNRFAYKLDGLDLDWVQRDASRRFASYTDVKPGEYIFRVRACNNDGIWNEMGTSLRVIIRPPFWQAWWFYTLVGLSAALSVYAVYRWRVRTLERRQQELELLVDQRTRELKEASLNDPLTGLRNRRFITEIVKNDARAFIGSKKFIVEQGPSRRNEELAENVYGIVMIDIDHFKAVNDTYGHETGDHLLVQLAKILVSSVRQDDVVVRMGGEEFLVILKKTDPVYLNTFVARIKEAVAAKGFAVAEDQETVLHKTISIGYAIFPFYPHKPDLVTLEQTIGLADLGLLHSKKNGRDRITRIYPTEVSIPAEEFSRVLNSLEYAVQKGWLKALMPYD